MLQARVNAAKKVSSSIAQGVAQDYEIAGLSFRHLLQTNWRIAARMVNSHGVELRD